MAKIWRAGVSIHIELACGHVLVADKASKRTLRTAKIGDLWFCRECSDLERARGEKP